MLERVYSLIPTIAGLEEQQFTIQGNEPYLEEVANYRFVANVALFKAPYKEIANKFWGLSFKKLLEFTLHLSRMIDRMFVKENNPYVSSFVIKYKKIRVSEVYGFNISRGRERTYYSLFNQRLPNSEFSTIINYIFNDLINTEDLGNDVTLYNKYDFYIIINRATPQLLEYIQNHEYYYIGALRRLPTEFLQSERLKLFDNREPEADYEFDESTEYFSDSRDDKILFKSFLDLEVPLLREDFNTLLPIIDNVFMKLLYLFELSFQGKDMLNLALTNTFSIKERTRGKISMDELKALENNEYNNYNEDAYRAISALAIVGANQSGKTYYSGVGDPKSLLRIMKEKYNNANLN